MENGLYLRKPEWSIPRARPRNIDELAEVVKNATAISTASNINDEIALPNPLRYLIERDRLRSMLKSIEESGKHDEEEPFPEVEELVNNMRSKALARSTARLEEIDAFLGHRETPEGVMLAWSEFPQSIDHQPDDQTVTICGPVSSLFSLNQTLAKARQCIPHGSDFADHRGLHSVVHGTTPQQAMDFNLPHALEAQCGSWRDWILEMVVVLADGSVVKSGSKVVKNVAGYDLHRFFVGTRGTLGIIVRVTLRTFPIASIPRSEIEVGKLGSQVGFGPSESMPESYWSHRWIQRTKPSDFALAVKSASDSLLSADHASSTLWAIVPPESTLERFSGDFVYRSHCGEKNLQITDRTQIKLMKRAKQIFDPTNKLNPGEWGFM